MPKAIRVRAAVAAAPTARSTADETPAAEQTTIS